MGACNDLFLDEIQGDIETGAVVTGPKAALFLCYLFKTKGKDCRTVESRFKKLKLHENYELVIRKCYQPRKK